MGLHTTEEDKTYVEYVEKNDIYVGPSYVNTLAGMAQDPKILYLHHE
jgi:hypothetical protein